MPLMTIVFGDLTGSFGHLSTGGMSRSQFMSSVEGMAL